MAMPFLTDPAGPYGFDKGSLSIVLSLNAVAYALSKFLMGSVSDRSNARVFLPLGLALAALSMMFMAVPIELFGASTTSIVIMAVLNFLVRGGLTGWVASLRPRDDSLVLREGARDENVYLELRP